MSAQTATVKQKSRSTIGLALGLALGLAILVAGPVEAQFGLDKIKKAVDKGLEVADHVDDFTFSEDEEVELGQAISQRIRARYGVAQDRDATRYLSLVGLTVAAKSGRAELPWQWIILDSSSVNAFAAPGGVVHVTRGALAVMDSEAELAGVLGHEIGHIVEKHTIKAIQKSQGMQLAQERTALTAGSALFNALADEAADAILSGFGRSEELEADQVGVVFAARAGYRPTGLVDFLQTLAAINAGSSSKAGLYRSHPETEERIKKINKTIRKDSLVGGETLAARYTSSISYDSNSGTTGGSAVEGARGVAGSDEAPPTETADESVDAEEGNTEEEQGGRFSLAKLKNPFTMGDEEESAEVSGAGAGRAIGDEGDDEDSGPKNPQTVVVQISPEEVSKFIQEGGLS